MTQQSPIYNDPQPRHRPRCQADTLAFGSIILPTFRIR